MQEILLLLIFSSIFDITQVKQFVDSLSSSTHFLQNIYSSLLSTTLILYSNGLSIQNSHLSLLILYLPQQVTYLCSIVFPCIFPLFFLVIWVVMVCLHVIQHSYSLLRFCGQFCIVIQVFLVVKVSRCFVLWSVRLI